MKTAILYILLSMPQFPAYWGATATATFETREACEVQAAKEKATAKPGHEFVCRTMVQP